MNIFMTVNNVFRHKKNKMMNKTISILFSLACALGFLAGCSAAENDNRWGVLYQPTWPNRDVWGCYENEVQYMKQWLMRRMEWLRAEFEKM